MQALAWLGFALGMALLLLTGSSVIKTLLIPRNLSSAIGTAVSRSVRTVYRLVTAKIDDVYRRERIMASTAPTYLFVLLVTWIACLYFAYTLLLLPFTNDSAVRALRLSGSSLFTLGFATPTGAEPYGIVFAAAISGLGVIALMIGYLPTLYAAYNRRETLVIMLEALAGKPPWGPELLARQQLIRNTSYLPRLYERWTEWAADISESHTTYRTLIYFRSRYPEEAWPLALLAVLDAAALHLSLNPESAPAETRPLLRVGYITMRSIAGTPGHRGERRPAPRRSAGADQGRFRRGDPAPGRGGLDVRAVAGRGVDALPRLAGELRDGRARHRRPPRPAAGAVVRAAGAPGPGAGTAAAARPPGTRDARRSRGIAAGHRHRAAYARLMTCANT